MLRIIIAITIALIVGPASAKHHRPAKAEKQPTLNSDMTKFFDMMTPKLQPRLYCKRKEENCNGTRG